MAAETIEKPEGEQEPPAGAPSTRPEAAAPAPTKGAAMPEPPRGLVRFADVTIGVAIAVALSQLVFAMQLHRHGLLKVIAALAAILFAAAYKLRPARRPTVAFVVLPALLLVYGFEWRISRKRPYDGTSAELRGIPYDSRSLWEAVRDARAEGKDAYPSIQPRALLVLNLSKGIAPDEIQNHTLSPEWGVVVDGERVLPLGGVANKHVVYCNEGGKYSTYESDEHGFNNPKGLWTRDTLDVAMIGDSFTQAACVGADENAAYHVRQKYPGTVNLGMAGNGPLIELAGLEELVAPKKPKIVLWTYYNNDLPDLDVEKRSPMLMRYLEEDGFSQKLASRQPKIDAALIELASRIEAMAPRWPSALATLGLTRQSSPMWLGDLAMNESHSATTAVLRLDRLSWGITSVVASDVLKGEPDYALFRRVLARAKSRVESWGGKLFFVYMADMYFLNYATRGEDPRRPQVLAAARESGIPIIDAHPTFMAESDPNRVRFHPESHCNPAGYKLLSEVLLKGLAEAGQ